MKKLKKQNIKSIINYNQLLKNNSLNEKQFQLRILYENIFLFKINDQNVIEFNNSKQLFFPLTLITYNKIAMFKSEYNKHIFLNYTLNYSLLLHFQTFFLNQHYCNENAVIRGRIIKRDYKYTKIIVYIFGILFILHTNHFNDLLHKLMTNKFIYVKKKPKKIRITRTYKIERGNKLIKKHCLKSFGFKIIEENNHFILSRYKYLKLLKKKPLKIENPNYFFKKKLNKIHTLSKAKKTSNKRARKIFLKKHKFNKKKIAA